MNLPRWSRLTPRNCWLFTSLRNGVPISRMSLPKWKNLDLRTQTQPRFIHLILKKFQILPNFVECLRFLHSISSERNEKLQNWWVQISRSSNCWWSNNSKLHFLNSVHKIFFFLSQSLILFCFIAFQISNKTLKFSFCTNI